MNYILIGRIFSVLACILMVVIGYIRHKRTVLLAQNVQLILFTISYAFFRRYGRCCQQYSQPHKKSYLLKMEFEYTTQNLFHRISGCIHLFYYPKHMGRLASIFSSHRFNYYFKF